MATFADLTTLQGTGSMKFRENLYWSFAKYALLNGESPFDLVECADFWLRIQMEISNVLISEKFIYDGTAIASQYIY